jgi:beta-lactamase regulating signal transducer with metallopeptidase domain
MSDLENGLRVLGSQLETAGRALVDRALTLNAWTAVLLGGALLVDRMLARRARASLRIALYAPVALRILLPLDWSLPIQGGPHLVSVLTPPALLAQQAPVGLASWQAPSWHAVAVLLYVAVAAFLAARAVVARVRLGRALAGARPGAVEGPPLPCPVVQHDELGPMVVGLLSPRIVLPRRLLAPGEENALACVLGHEAAHVRRHDAWLSASMQLLATAAWPVAPLWIAIARVRQLVELACDEAALAGADANGRRHYGHALLDMAEWRWAVTPLGAGELHFGSTLRSRVEALASQRHWPVAAQALALSIAPIVMLGACSGTAASPAPTASDTSSLQADPGSDYGYRFEVDSPTVAARNRGAAPPTASPDGRVTPEKVQAVVRTHFDVFTACYDAGLRSDPKLAGIVNVKSVVDRDGVTVQTQDVGNSDAPWPGTTLPDKNVVACIVSEFGKITYPPGPGFITVLYPIQFGP